ncbi:MAG: D-alanyl-D-alanine carboxypeptidase/D-alanyl-D-alanine-endopeptidase [Betaproteobacteria bacterium]|nr:D-alanyl-D-alanine carboxypeptidase/D-alanyl-D-alanine-endopeptidase [Betaproteobacteria bacterium]
MQISSVLSVKFLFLFFAGCCLSLILGAQELPADLMAQLDRLKINPRHVGVVIQKVSSVSPIVALNNQTSYEPASVIKIVTAYSSLSILGPDYTWLTSIKGHFDESGTTIGDVVVEAQGDPFLTLEEWIGLWRKLYLLGVHNINGNVLIDNNRYQIDYPDPDIFDHQGDRVYNLIPYPLTIDFDRLAINITPVNKTLQLSTNYKWKKINLINNLISEDLPCQKNPEKNVVVTTSHQQEQTMISVSGRWPISCGVGQLSRRILPNQAIIEQTIRQTWQELGGSFSGKVLFNQKHEELPLLVSHESLPLFMLIPLMDKYSNNVIARMLYLNTGNTDATKKTSYQQSEAKVMQFLQDKGINIKGLTLKNGSGLSREARITPDFLNNLLQTIWRDPLGHEVVTSFPLIGSEGTLRQIEVDSAENKKMYLKTGTLKEVKSIAGFVQTKKGDWYSIVCLINDSNAQNGSAWIQSLLDWLYLTQ